MLGRKPDAETPQDAEKRAKLEKLDSIHLTQSVMELLRPRDFSEIVGQERAVKSLLAKLSSPYPQHLLLYGPPGLGKTTLANIIANEMGTSIRITSGPAIEKPGEMAAILNNLQEGDLVDDCPVFEITLEGINVTGVKKLLDVLPSMATIREDMTPSTETLKSGVRLQRMGKLRILNLVDTSSAADGTIVNLAAGDRPANYVFAPAVVRGQTYPDFFISVTPASMGTGKVGLFRGANVQMQYNGYICSQIAWLVD